MRVNEEVVWYNLSFYPNDPFLLTPSRCALIMSCQHPSLPPAVLAISRCGESEREQQTERCQRQASTRSTSQYTSGGLSSIVVSLSVDEWMLPHGTGCSFHLRKVSLLLTTLYCYCCCYTGCTWKFDWSYSFIWHFYMLVLQPLPFFMMSRMYCVKKIVLSNFVSSFLSI